MVHPPEQGSEKVYDFPSGVLETSWRLCCENQGRLTEGDLIRLTEEAYAGFVLTEDRAFADIQPARVRAAATACWRDGQPASR